MFTPALREVICDWIPAYVGYHLLLFQLYLGQTLVIAIHLVFEHNILFGEYSRS